MPIKQDLMNPDSSRRQAPASMVLLPATLQRRGAVFIACHNQVWEMSGALMKASVNPDLPCQLSLRQRINV